MKAKQNVIILLDLAALILINAGCHRQCIPPGDFCSLTVSQPGCCPYNGHNKAAPLPRSKAAPKVRIAAGLGKAALKGAKLRPTKH